MVSAPAATGSRRRVLFDLLVLGVVFAVIAWRIVPSHWTSVWMDREFSGWVAPVANRVAAGERLYADGLHSPMPPLPFVVMAVAHGGGATWLDESRLNVILQIGLLLLAYAALARVMARPVPLFAVLLATPVIFSLSKTIVYDAMAQFWVALLGLLLVLRATPGGRWRIVALDAGLAIGTALLLLTKQSTALGAFLGTALALWWIDAGAGRWKTLLRYAGGMGLATWVLIGVVLRRHVDPAGLLRDVFVRGSETKGGALAILGKLHGFGWEFGGVALGIAVVGLVLVVSGWLRVTPADRPAWPERGAPGRRRLVLFGCAAAVALVLPLLLAQTEIGMAQRGAKVLNGIRPLLFWASLVALVLTTVRVLRAPGRSNAPAAAGVALVALFFLSALFHSLSVHEFRWFYDNNPLIVLVLAFVFAPLLTESLPRPLLLLGALLPLACWSAFTPQVRACLACREVWPEVRHLQGAKLRASANGMRELVGHVRRLAPDPRDEVLLLPGDPNVEAWFERRRPALTSAVVFADQYWDRFVDADFERLRARPPRVIVIGPRNYWRAFQRQWHTDWGCERLVDRVGKELIAASYVLAGSQAIEHAGTIDQMDIYVRRDEAARSPAVSAPARVP